MKIRLLALIGGLFLTVSSAQAQKPIRSVFISGGGEHSGKFFAGEVVKALTQRVGTSARLSVVTDELQAELLVSLTCVDMHDVARDVVGGVCSYIFTYYPDGLPGFCMILVGPEMANGDSDNVAEVVFHNLLEASSEEQLKVVYTAARVFREKQERAKSKS